LVGIKTTQQQVAYECELTHLQRDFFP